MCPITFFEDKRVIDVSCGDRFTVVVAEEAIDSRPNTASQQEEKINDDELTFGQKKEEQMKIINKRMIKMKNFNLDIKSVRRPLCGGDLITDGLRVKILEVIKRN